MTKKRTPPPDINSVSAPSEPISSETIYVGFLPKPPTAEPRPIPPRGALDVDVINDAGRIDLRVLARILDLSVPDLAAIVHASPRTVKKNPDAKSLQPAAQKLVHFINGLTAALGERRFAIYWLNTPQSELKDDTPLTWMRKGRLDEIADYVDAFIRMQPD